MTLGSNFDRETIEIIETEIISVIEETLRKCSGRFSRIVVYSYNPAAAYMSQIQPPSQLLSRTEQNISEKRSQTDHAFFI